MIIVRELNEYGAKKGGSACLVRLDDQFFVISSIPVAPDHGGPETLAFAADEDGEVIDWSDVAGGRGWTRDQTIVELEEKGANREASGRGIFGDTKNFGERSAGEVLEGTINSLGVIAGTFGDGPAA